MKVSVALPVPLRREFDYHCEAADADQHAVGTRVRVPFGSRQLVGVVTRVDTTVDRKSRELRNVLAVLDRQALFPQPLWRLLLWSSQYYQHPLGEVLHTALPVRLRRGEPAVRPVESAWALTSEGAAIDPTSLTRAPLQRAILGASGRGSGP